MESKDRNPALHLLSVEKVFWVNADFLIHQIVGAASTKAAATVGGNAPLTSGKETESISALWNCLWSKKRNNSNYYQVSKKLFFGEVSQEYFKPSEARIKKLKAFVKLGPFLQCKKIMS